MPLKCLVTGGNGFVGRWIVTELIKRTDYHITIFDITIPVNVVNTDRFSYLAGDITDKEGVQQALRGHDICIHVASPPHNSSPKKFKQINIHGTQNIIDGCLAEGVGRLVYTSSTIVAGDASHVAYVDETAPLPKTYMDAYSETKAIAEGLCLKANCDRLLTCAIRPSGIFGPGDTQGTPAFIQGYKEGQHVVQIGDNSPLCDFTYVENIAYAHVLAAEKLIPGSKIAGQAFFISNDCPIPFWNHQRALLAQMGVIAPYRIIIPIQIVFIFAFLSEMMIAVQKLLGKEVKVGFTRSNVRHIAYSRYYNITKAKELLGYKPVVDYKEGVKRTMKYFMAQEEETAIAVEPMKV